MGEVKIHAFHGGGEVADMSVFDPFHPDVGTKVDIPYFFYVIEHPDGNVLFDTGGHPALATNPRDYLGEAADAFEVKMTEDDAVVPQIESAGFKVGDIAHVVQSHLHYDHAGGIQFFPDADFYAQAIELEFANNPPIYQAEIYLPADFDHPVRWTELEGDHDLFGDGRVLIFPTPGHTKGHQSMLVKLDDRAVILVADAAYLPRNLELNVLPGIVWSPDAMVASWDRIRELKAEHDAELIFTHDLAWPETTKVAPEEHYE